MRSEKLASVGRMAASIAHEINNPLEAVTNSLFLIHKMKDLPEAARQFLDTVDEELNRIAYYPPVAGILSRVKRTGDRVGHGGARICSRPDEEQDQGQAGCN
jgi:hypothetical protein